LATERPAEAGYTLVALLALMTILSLFAMAVAPSAQQQALREREKEAIFRGEQIADAIRDYYRYRVGVTRQVGDASLPTSMDQLLQGIPIPSGAKNRMILRASAARDPLTIEGEWRFIRPRSESLIDFQQSVMFYAGNVLPPPRDQQIAQLQQSGESRQARGTAAKLFNRRRFQWSIRRRRQSQSQIFSADLLRHRGTQSMDLHSALS
jgi:type II secretory pathway pseudopilin PulG